MLMTQPLGRRREAECCRQQAGGSARTSRSYSSRSRSALLAVVSAVALLRCVQGRELSAANPEFWDINRRFPEDNYQLIIYNRVPKTGSTSMQAMLTELSHRNNFRTMHTTEPQVKLPEGSVAGWRIPARNPREEHLTSYANFYTAMARDSTEKHQIGAIADHHWPFVHFKKVGGQQPLYINSLRDPLKRALSFYFYLRSGPRPHPLIQESVKKYGNLTLEGCMALYQKCKCQYACETPEQQRCTRHQCSDLYGNLHETAQFMYFCPWGAPQCTRPDRRALSKAKEVLRDRYAMFMILERLDESRMLMELALPQYFAGMAQMHQRRERTTAAKPEVPEPVMTWLKDMAALEIEFYEYATQLFEERLEAAMELLESPRGEGRVEGGIPDSVRRSRLQRHSKASAR